MQRHAAGSTEARRIPTHPDTPTNTVLRSFARSDPTSALALRSRPSVHGAEATAHAQVDA